MLVLNEFSAAERRASRRGVTTTTGGRSGPTPVSESSGHMRVTADELVQVNAEIDAVIDVGGAHS